MFPTMTIKNNIDDENYINTFDDWHLIPSEWPTIAMPEMREQTVELIGANGDLDLSESLTGYPLFGNRTGSWEFIVLNSYNGVDNFNQANLYSTIARALHGQKRVIQFSNDPDYFYQGRLRLGEWSPDANNSTITIDYTLDPYKYHVKTAKDEQKNDEDRKGFAELSINGDLDIDFNFANYVDSMPVHPIIYIKSDGGSLFKATFTNTELNMKREFSEFLSGVGNSVPRFTISNFTGSNVCKFSFNGLGSLQIDFRNGRL